MKLVRFDWAIKNILRDKANFDVLEGFLCALLEDNEIRIIQLLGEEGQQEDEDDKFNRVDILIEDSKQRKIIIEVQNTRESDYLERLLFGTSRTIIDYHGLGKPYGDITKVISVSILYFNLGRGDDYFYKGTTKFIGMNTGTPLVVKKRIPAPEEITNLKFKFVEKDIFPEYYLIRVEKYPNIIRKAIDEWIYMFKNSEIQEGSKSKNIDKAKEKLKILNMTEAERKRYYRYMDGVVREQDQIATAKIEGFDEGKNEMIIEGFKEGLSISMLSKISKKTETEVRKVLKEAGLQ